MASDIIGKVLLNQFRVDSYVASGGMASVFRVQDLKRNVPLAMKVLNNDLAEDPSMLKRFQREARALQKLVHPNIVPFYGLHHTEEFTFLLELYIDGPNLKEVLQRASNRSLSLPDALIYLKAMCAALGYAHANEVVHCDIKPGNVMIDRGGNIYLADFGIARHAESTTTTMAGAGTAAYMAPEQIREEAVSPATDVYALGIVAYELLTGKRPFRGEEDSSSSRGKTAAERLRHAHLTAQPPDPRQLRPELPPALSAVLMQSLAKDPKERFPSTRDFFTAMCQAAGVSPEDVPDRAAPESMAGWADSHEVLQTVGEDFQEVKPNRFPEALKRYGLMATGVLVVIVLILFVPKLISGRGVAAGPAISATLETARAGSVDLPTSTPTVLIPSATATTAPPTDTPEPTMTPTKTPLSFDTMKNSADGAEMVRIPAGEFTMGADPNEIAFSGWDAAIPAHPIQLDSYWIYRTEVTNQMYAICDAENQCPKPARFSSDPIPDYYTEPQYADYPVVNVNWDSALSYCLWAKGRLPSEAEWEKAARGDDRRLFPWGDEYPGNTRANFCDRNCQENEPDASFDDQYSLAAPVGSYPDGASYYGLLDMAGNVYEWVNDWFDDAYYRHTPKENPQGPGLAGKYPTRVVRGGSWASHMSTGQTFARYYFNYQRTYSYLGFRCVVDVAE